MVGGQPKTKTFEFDEMLSGKNMIKKRTSTWRLCSTQLGCYSIVVVSSLPSASASNFTFTINLGKPR